MHKKPPTVDPANPTSAEKLDQEATARVNAIGASVLSVLLDHEGPVGNLDCIRQQVLSDAALELDLDAITNIF